MRNFSNINCQLLLKLLIQQLLYICIISFNLHNNLTLYARNYFISHFIKNSRKFKSQRSLVILPKSASKEISLLKNNHICQQFPVPAPHQQVLSHALFSLSPQNTSPGRIIIATFTDKDHLTSKVAELEPRFPIWKLSIP